MRLNKMLTALVILAGLWLLLELAVRAYVELPLETDFYSSIPRQKARELQEKHGVKTSSGPGWFHLGWVADPESESYRIERREDSGWSQVAQVQYGSFLSREQSGTYRVLAAPQDGSPNRVIGEVTVASGPGTPPIYVPRIAGTWQTLFKPEQSGFYINDHTIYRDAEGSWRLIGITSKTNGDYNQEKYFAVGVSATFPPEDGMVENDLVADFGELAWAPHVVSSGESFHMFWSPHKLHQMDSLDGINWNGHRITMPAPHNKFFRDPMVIQVAEDQWLLYTTARGSYFSQVDVYQSFDLSEWQYIRTALGSGRGSERNSPFASTESPFVAQYEGRYYLTVTYNNDSFFWPGILLLFQVWPDPKSYNDTLVLHADNPYDFGVYRGRGNTPNLLTRLETHAPEFVNVHETGSWYITTAGWPWVATLTSGEVAVAPLAWEPLP